MKKLLALLMGMTVAWCTVAVQAQPAPGTPKPAAPVAVAPPAAADLTPTGKVLADISAKASGGLAMIQISLSDEIFGKGNIAGLAICKSVEGKRATLITMILDPRVQFGMVGEIFVIPAGGRDKPIKAHFVGIDPETSISYLTTDEDYDWVAIPFDTKSNLSVGKQVFSAGLLDPTLGFAPYVGSAYVSALLKVPGDLVYVNGSLTAVGSPVFNAEGKAIGIVQQQLPSQVTIMGGNGGQSANVGMRSTQETQYFVPVEEFASALQNVPGRDKRLPWIGVLNFTTLPAGAADMLKIGTAVMVGKVIPGTPAETAGLKDGDFVTKLNGKELEKLSTAELTMLNFVRQLMRTPAGKSVKLTVVHGASEPKEMEVATEPTPDRPDMAPRTFAKRLGLIVREKVKLDTYMDPTPTATVDGLYVVGTTNGGPAANAGIKTDPPDMVTAIGATPVKTIGEFNTAVNDAIAKATPGQAITVLVRRGATQQSLAIVPGPEPVTPK